MNRASRTARSGVAAAALLLSACGRPAAPASSSDVAWDTLPSGAPHAVYASMPAMPLFTSANLRIGGPGGAGPAALGDVRAIEVDPAGSVLVLDARAGEVRAFDASGAFTATRMRRGEGPGEIARANGMALDTTGALWVNDHGRGQVTRLGPDGAVATFPALAPEYGFLWEGAVTRDGRLVEVQRRSDPGSAPGPQDVQLRLLLTTLDPASGARDSASLGTITSRAAVYPMVVAALPFSPAALVALDPAGAVWTASSSAYRITKHGLDGDTLLVVETPAGSADVSAAERAAEAAKLDALMADARKRGGSAGRGSEGVDWAALIPGRKPVLVSLSVDDQSRLWVQRRTPVGGAVFDVFAPGGEVLGTVRPDFTPAPWFPPVIRGGAVYAVVTDSLDVPAVVRAPTALR